MFSRIAAAAFGFITLATLSIAPAHASTVTLNFDGVTNSCGICGPGFPTSIVEQGYTISGSPSAFSPGSVHLDDSGTSFSSIVSFSQVNPFAVHSVDILGFGTEFFGYDPVADIDVNLPYNNVLFQGFRNGLLVASGIFSTGIANGIFNVTFGSLFSNLDVFSISAVGPSAAEFAGNRGSYCAGAPCGHFEVDNLVLTAAVPLPAMAPALAGSLALLGLFGWKRRVA